MPKARHLPPAARYCTYCGKELHRGLVSNKEHAVGRQFFPEPRPIDLGKVVVPSCRDCNEQPKPDEDYLRGLLSLSKAALSTVGQRIHPVALRAFQKDSGLRKAIARGITRNVELRSESGIYLGRRTTQTIEWERVRRVLAKWVRGLYWLEHGERLAVATTFEVAMVPLERAADIAGPLSRSSRTWPGTFEYWHSRDEADSTKSKWSFVVWGVTAFIAVTNQRLEVLELDASD